jgi:hypothetical protein
MMRRLWSRSSTGISIYRLITKPQMVSELWHQRLGHPRSTHLSLRAQHSTVLPSKLMAGLHPMRSCQACTDGKIKRSTMGETSDTAKILSGTRIHLGFGFIRASSLDFGITDGHRNVTSYNGNTHFLRIVCTKALHTWVFFSSQRPHQSISSNAF